MNDNAHEHQPSIDQALREGIGLLVKHVEVLLDRLDKLEDRIRKLERDDYNC